MKLARYDVGWLTPIEGLAAGSSRTSGDRDGAAELPHHCKTTKSSLFHVPRPVRSRYTICSPPASVFHCHRMAKWSLYYQRLLDCPWFRPVRSMRGPLPHARMSLVWRNHLYSTAQSHSEHLIPWNPFPNVLLAFDQLAVSVLLSIQNA